MIINPPCLSQFDACTRTWESHIQVENEAVKDVYKCPLLLVIELAEIVVIVKTPLSHLSQIITKSFFQTDKHMPSQWEYYVLRLKKLVCLADYFQNVAGKHKMSVYEVVCQKVP